jgi:uncharacterized protein YkwD
MCLGLYSAAAYANDNITVIADGWVIEFDQGPAILDGQVMVPVRNIAEAMGWNVESNPYGIYLQKTGDIEIIPGRLFYTYYKTIVGLTDGELEVRHYDTLGGFDIFHFKYGHFPARNNEICPGGKPCGMIDEETAHQLTVKPVLHNGRMLMALEDLAGAMYAAVEWDGNSRTVTFSSEPLPYCDGYGLPEEYRVWLLERTYEAHKQNGAVAPWIVTAAPALSDDEKLRVFETEVFRLVNETRQEYGLQPLSTHPELDAAAQLRAGELTASMSHTRPCGSPPSSAYASVPYEYNGENIQLTSMRNSPEVSANSATLMWMHSDGHKANILNPDTRYMGVSAAHGEDGILYAVQGFAK